MLFSKKQRILNPKKEHIIYVIRNHGYHSIGIKFALLKKST